MNCTQSHWKEIENFSSSKNGMVSKQTGVNVTVITQALLVVLKWPMVIILSHTGRNGI